MPFSPRPFNRSPHRPFARRRRPLGWTLLLAGFGLAAAACAAAALLACYVALIAAPRLPPLDVILDYRPKMPLRVYTADHVLIGEFGVEHRRLMRFGEIPDVMKQAVLAVEDYRFYEHGGIDAIGILRAAAVNLAKGAHAQGASTITMQVARNLFLSNEKTYTRKLYEMLLAYRIESALTKDQILELYMNQIYLGQRAYGFAAAARVYFGKDLRDVTLAEAAMLAGLPKAPSAYNPIVSPKRAKGRQQSVLQRMLDLQAITRAQYDAALNETLRVKGRGNEFSVHAEYVAEMVRQTMVAQYGDAAYSRGLNVVTTIESGHQKAAYDALRNGLLDYERRHGYRGPEGFVELPADRTHRDRTIADALLDHPDSGTLKAAVVTSATPDEVRAELLDGSEIALRGDGLRFAAQALSTHAPAARRIKPGALIRVMQRGDGAWEILQLPQIDGAFVSLAPQDGAIRALVGGFDFRQNEFNHATQAWRQPGSSFKPFIYSAALEKGLGPATVVDDAPLYFSAAQTGGRPWQPKNIGGSFLGPITLRTALEKSRNLVSIRILNYVTPAYAQRYVTRFGFDADRHPAYLPMALGAGAVTPLQMASAYAVFANGGYRVAPYLIAEVGNADGVVIARAQPATAGGDAPQAIDPRNAYLMTNLLEGAAQRGTGSRSNVLQRADLGGKTGTTNDSRDAWFAGFQHELAAVAWIGYDQPRSLGGRETGSGLALPVWIDYMRIALHGVPEYRPPPDGIVTIGDELYRDDALPDAGFVARIDGDGSPEHGLVTVDDAEKRQILELFSRP